MNLYKKHKSIDIQVNIFIFILFTFTIFSSLSQTDKNSYQPEKPSFLKEKTPWADSVLKSMTLDEKIGQLFMVAAYSNKENSHYKETAELIQKYYIGGLIFFKGTPHKQAQLTNYYQSISKTPLMIGIDGEWGISMRLDSTTLYPRQMMLGAIQNDKIIYEMGKQIANQCKIMGIHVNFAPVIDVNNNANNPVINNRSFGESKEQVSRLGLAYMKGMQDNGIMACGKHFPGHGDTDTDSHLSLPVINHSYGRLDSLELYPFRALINEGLASIMVAHLFIPALDNTQNQASTLSSKIVNGLLKDSLKYEGLVFTDALNMKGVSKYFDPGKLDVKALMAGNDVLLFPENVPFAIQEIKKAIEKGNITEEDINQRCLKILKAKEWVKVHQFTPILLENLYERLNPIENEVLNRKIADESITLIQNKNQLLPFKRLDSTKIGYINFGGTRENNFHQSMNYYTLVEEVQVPRSLSEENERKLFKSAEKYDKIIVGYHNTNNNPKRNFGITIQSINILKKLAETKDVVAVIFGNPYVLESFGDISKVKSIIIGYQDTEHTQKSAGELIFGGIIPQGKLPVSCSKEFPLNTGLTYDSKTRLHFVLPEEIGLSSEKLFEIDQIALQSIKSKIFPGCQILAIKSGNVFYHKSFGHHTYKNKTKVKWNDLYDLASITKIGASTYAMMRLTDDSLVDINKKLGDYIPEIVGETPYKNMVIKEMMAHQAGLISWIPFYTKTLLNGEPNPEYYSKDSSAIYDLKVADNLYIKSSYQDTIFNRITSTDLKTKKYKYSDLGYYFLRRIIEKQTGMSLNEYVMQTFYQPMGLPYMGYHPLYRFDKDKIIPTENDTIFRKQLIWGDVHDPGAAMSGGVGGHAGLFSNALDLGVLMYTLINDGNYGGVNYLNKNTIDDFTRCQFCSTNRRGAGFDRPVNSLDGGPTCGLVSLSSFGHQGFTGTICWADPEHEIVYVFLSNRVYPDAENWLLVKEGIRTKIQEVIYKVAK